MSKKKYYVLHLEDNRDIADLLTMILENENIDYKHVQTFKQAYEQLDKVLPHLMLVDLMLEDDIHAEPGIKFIKDAYQKYPGLKMMVLSNRGDSRIKKELINYIVDFVEKIFKPSAFKTKLIQKLNDIYLTK